MKTPCCCGFYGQDLPLSSVSPPSPLLAGELPPHAPNAFAPSPRKGGEEEEEEEEESTQPHTSTQQ